MTNNKKSKSRSVRIDLAATLSAQELGPRERLQTFALIVLGIVDSIHRGSLTTDDAIATFFHYDNIVYARRNMRNRVVQEIMGAGAQLSDLFDVLPPAIAQQAFQVEIAKLRTLCTSLIGRLPAAA